IQRILKLAIKRSALSDIVDHTMVQLNSGITPDQIAFDKRMGVVRDRSVMWLINGYMAINNPEIIQKAFRLCSTGEEDFNLSYDSLTSEEAEVALVE
ncbi:hypothetical protein BJ322DRAFT_991400, partial [Thelephora terrestris]